MIYRLTTLAVLMVIAGEGSPAIAGKSALDLASGGATATEQAQVITAHAVVEACAQGSAEDLPIPFSDVSPDHWAFESVMTMYYCGAYRPPVPPDVMRQLLLPTLPDNS